MSQHVARNETEDTTQLPIIHYIESTLAPNWQGQEKLAFSKAATI
jgi:hypothetical protein